MTRRLRNILVMATLAVCTSNLLAAPGPAVKDGDVVAVIGDSITEGRTYGVLMETYLLACQPAKVRVMQFGWSGETVAGFNVRLPEFAAMKPTLATLCYGMNDGRYVPIRDDIKTAFHTGLLRGVQTLQQGGTRVVVGSPGCVDPNTFKRDAVSAADYNDNLAALTAEAADVARATGSGFADVHAPMLAATLAAKQRYGDSYAVAGGDGVHPGPSGGLVMAYAFLKGLGFDGNVGTLYVDLANHSAKAFGGHKFDKAEGDAFTFTSTTYPFCFDPDPAHANRAAAVLDFVPFNAELNRFTLTAVGPAKGYKVTWGKSTKTFTAEQLKAGVNLAAEFPDNPFTAPFLAVQKKVYDKQTTEILLLKRLLHDAFEAAPLMPDARTAVPVVAEQVSAAQTKLAADVAQSVAPVTHTITFEPIQ